jgi:hypothetical protein
VPARREGAGYHGHASASAGFSRFGWRPEAPAGDDLRSP